MAHNQRYRGPRLQQQRYHSDTPTRHTNLSDAPFYMSAGGGDDDPPPPSSTAVNIESGGSVHQRKTRLAVMPSTYEVPIWATYHVNAARYNIGARSGTAIVCILFVAFLWATLWVPTWPSDWYRYCAMYYVLQLPFYITNLFFPLNIEVNNMYGIFALINTGLLAFQSFLVFLFGWTYYNCWIGTLPYSCTDNYLIDLIMLALTLILWTVGLMTAVYFWSVTLRTSGTSKPTLLEYLSIN